MADKEIKRLRRRELLEMLLIQTQRVEELERELAEAKKELAERHIVLKNAGSIAEAALELNKVFETAQRAAEQYVDSVTQMYRVQETAGNVDEKGKADNQGA